MSYNVLMGTLNPTHSLTHSQYGGSYNYHSSSSPFDARTDCVERFYRRRLQQSWNDSFQKEIQKILIHIRCLLLNMNKQINKQTTNSFNGP